MFYSFVRFVFSVNNCGYFSANDHLGFISLAFLFFLNMYIYLTHAGRVSVNQDKQCFFFFHPLHLKYCDVFLSNMSWTWVLY